MAKANRKKCGEIMNVDIVKKVIELVALVESESKEGCWYKVWNVANIWNCSCPNLRDGDCKHIEVVKGKVGI